MKHDLGYSEENGLVVLRMGHEDYYALKVIVCLAIGAMSSQGNAEHFHMAMRLNSLILMGSDSYAAGDLYEDRPDLLIPESVAVRMFNERTGANCKTVGGTIRWLRDHPEAQRRLNGEDE